MNFYWTVPNSDLFTTAGEWTPAGVPGASDQAFLSGTGTAYDVNVTNGDSETVLTISTSADAILNITQNSSFTAEDGTGSGANNGSIQVSDTSVFNVAGTINNNGTIKLMGTGAGASLLLLGDTTLNGGMTTLSSNGLNVILGGGTLTNANNSDISGAGQIDVAVINKALIDATSNSAVLELNGAVTNTGQLFGDGAAGLSLQSTVNNIGGTIEADTGLVVLGSFSFGHAGTIIGGTIVGAGTFLLEQGSLDGSGTHPITINGQITAAEAATIDVAGAFKTGTGSTLALGEDSGLLLGLPNVAAADATFSGGGQVVMTVAAIDLDPSTHAGSVPPKLNNVDDTIEGTGTIGNPSSPGSIVLNNEAKGIVEALKSAQPLTIYSNIINAGVLDAANGGFLILGGNAVTNTGSLKAEAGGDIALQGTTIHGGTLTGAGRFDVGHGAFDLDGAVLDGSTSMLTNASTIDMQTGLGLETTTLTLEGTINNTGAMELGTSGTGGAGTFAGPIPIGSDLVIGATAKSTQVTLKGGGSIGLAAYGDDYIIGDADFPGGVPTTLDNVNDVIIGAGRIGDGGLTLKNSGSIDAEGSTPLVIDTGARTVTNTGSMTAESALYIDSPLNNTGGNLTAIHDGDLIAEQGATGGTATAAEGGIIEFGGPTTTAVQFSDNPFVASDLVLDDSVHFKGVISGFAKVNVDETIDLVDINSATAQKVSYTGGVLTIKDASGHTAQLHFSGTYTLASFNLNPDHHGGTLLTDPPAAPPPANAAVFGHYMAAAFAAGGASLSGLPVGSETFSQPLLASPHG